MTASARFKQNRDGETIVLCGVRDRNGAQTCAGKFGWAFRGVKDPFVSLDKIFQKQPDGTWSISPRNAKRRARGLVARLRRPINRRLQFAPGLGSPGASPPQIRFMTGTFKSPLHVFCPRCGRLNEIDIAAFRSVAQR